MRHICVWTSDPEALYRSVSSYEGEWIELLNYPIRSSELLTAVKTFRLRTNDKIVIRTDESIEDNLVRIAGLQKYPNLFINNTRIS